MMAIDIDATRYENEDSIGNYLGPGQYHCAIDEYDDEEKDGTLIVYFKALAGTVPNCAGKRHKEYFSLSDAAMPRVQRLAMATGVVKGGERRSLDPGELLCRQLIIEIEPKEYTNNDGEKKKNNGISFVGMWSVDNPVVTDVPKDEAAIEAWKSGDIACVTSKDDEWASL